MSATDEFFVVTSDYAGREGDSNFLPVKKDDIVKVINKEVVFFICEKQGQIGKVPKGKLRLCSNAPTSNKDQSISTSQSRALDRSNNLSQLTSSTNIISTQINTTKLQRNTNLQVIQPSSNSQTVQVIQYEVLADYNNPDTTKYLNVKKGDRLTKINEPAPGWSMCSKDGRKGYVPTSYIRPAADTPSITKSSTVMSNSGGGEYYELLADYNGKAGDPKFLKVNKGYKVKMIKKDEGWSKVEYNGQQGLVPTSYLKVLTAVETSSISQSVPVMSSPVSEEYYEVLKEYIGLDNCTEYLKVNKDDSVEMIKKDHGLSKVEKDGLMDQPSQITMGEKKKQFFKNFVDEFRLKEIHGDPMFYTTDVYEQKIQNIIMKKKLKPKQNPEAEHEPEKRFEPKDEDCIIDQESQITIGGKSHDNMSEKISLDNHQTNRTAPEVINEAQFEVIADYNNTDTTKYLNVKKGDRLTKINEPAPGWSMCSKDGRKGYVPTSYIR
ncbi:MAG: hypothetical protein EZS28_023891, partial [Streblomastix strix]